MGLKAQPVQPRSAVETAIAVAAPPPRTDAPPMAVSDSASEKSLRRVLLVSAIDGWSLTVFAGLCTLISLLFGEWVGVYIGGIVTGAGIMELRGRARLLAGNLGGLSGLILAQVLILATVGLYAFRNLLAFDQAAIMANFTPEMREYLELTGIAVSTMESLLQPVYYGLYLTIIGVTLLFQGGLALYYFSRRAKITTALAARQLP
jgi:hypothetical protein